MKEIELSIVFKALVDDEDYDMEPVVTQKNDLAVFLADRKFTFDPLLDFVVSFELNQGRNGEGSGFIEWYIPENVKMNYNVDFMKIFFHTIEVRADWEEDFIAGPRLFGQYIKGYFRIPEKIMNP